MGGTERDWTLERDWTWDADGNSNSSPEFLALCDEVERLIRSDAHSLIAGRAGSTARLIVAQLAHVHKLMLPFETEWQPIETAPREEDFLAHLGNGYITRGRFINGRYFACDASGPTQSKTDPTHWKPLPTPPATQVTG